MAKVIFEVGSSHPLYNKVVEAEITIRNGGYNGKCIEAITKEEVYHPSDPKGICLMDKFMKVVGYKERSAYSEKWQGWVKEIVEDDLPNCFEADIYDFNSGKLVSQSFGEEHPYYKGEIFQPIENVECKVVFASSIINGKQIVACVRTDLD